MIVVVLAASALSIVSALPQAHSGPSPVLSARQEVVTNAYGVTKTVQQSTGPNKAVAIGATAAVIVGFIALILVGVWIGSRRSKKNAEWRKSMMDAQQEAKNQHRLTMGSRRPGSAHMTSMSSISSSSKNDRKSSAHSLTPSTAPSFASSGVPTSPPHEQRRTVLHQPSPRTPSILVQSPLLQHSEYPPPPSNDRSLPPPSPEMNRASLYQQQPSRPSPLSNSVTLPPSEVIPLTQSPSSFEPPTRNNDPTSNGGAPPVSRRPNGFQPPAKRKSSGDINLTITVPPHREAPNAPPGLDNRGDASPNSIRSGEMGKAF